MKKIPLTQGKFALVDDGDYEMLNQFKWFALKRPHTFYAARNIPGGKRQKTIYMHTVIMQTPKDMEVDHRDGNGLINQRYNLRVCTRSQNSQNLLPQGGTSKYKGVHWYKAGNRWQGHIRHNYKKIHLGYYTDEIEAARAYDEKAKELFGKFAHLNFPERG